MHAEPTDNGQVVVSMSNAEAVAIRELIAFADFTGDLPARHPAEATVVSRLLTTLDVLIPELGSDAYGSVVEAAWAALNPAE